MELTSAFVNAIYIASLYERFGLMQQFATASVSPRSIAWLIRPDEWDRFEKIVKYNCAIVGGYFNVVIPLTDQDTLTEEYQRFLADYDPDLVVLAPGMASTSLEIFKKPLYPFAFIPWDSVSLITSLDPLAARSGMNATMMTKWAGMLTQAKWFVNTFVAVASEVYPDAAKLALVACGDVEPREPMWEKMDDNISLDAFGYREQFLAQLLKPEYDQKSIEAHLDDTMEVVPPPDRYQLAKLISEQHQFPLAGAVQILKTCCELQKFPHLRQSFIGLTADYKHTGGTSQRSREAKYPPTMVLLISDEFTLQEATLFWNLRASEVYVAWLSFSDLENNLGVVAKWLESDYGGIFYWLSTASNIAFASSVQDNIRLQLIVDKLKNKRKAEYPIWETALYTDLLFYNYIKPYMQQKHVTIAIDGSKCMFIPKLPQENNVESYAVTLEWQNLMLPRNGATLLSEQLQNSVEYLSFPKPGIKSRQIEKSVAIPRFRVEKNRYLRMQCYAETPLVFNMPSSEAIVEACFHTSGFSRIERSSAAKYQMSFLQSAGGLENAAHYLSTSPYRELLELLANNDREDRNKVGWIIDKRRVLHHYYIRDVLGKHIPAETKKYFDTVSDELPTEVINLLEKGILERGFRLVCSSCSFSSWYPCEQVGQTFKCTRCYQLQVYKANPLWLYKLTEVIFHGFAQNMHVPLLSLDYLKHRSKHHFAWIPDSDVYWLDNNNELHRNLDILSLSDGKLYVGEAKSNDRIDAEQFSFYEDICRRVAIDGIVFATTQPHWNKGTLQRIEKLQAQYDGEVIVLTQADLYRTS